MSGDNSLTATATDQSTAGPAELLPILRWVHPKNAVTVLASAAVVLGRDAEAGMRLASEQVSRRHAEAAALGDGAVLRDLGSKNGSFVNGKRVECEQLVSGDVVRLGDHVAVFERIPAQGLPGFAELGPGLFGGAVMRAVVERARRASLGPLSLVLQGETGTGKERFAHSIHTWSGRPGPFVAVNCANYTTSTALAELFGYRKGAFTGAERSSVGHVRAAHHGTLLLDEVLDLPLDVQAKLLRVLEQREVLALGETVPVSVDVRFLAASQLPLSEAVAAGRFRADLCARLEGMTIEIPPLRARRADVIPLFLELLTRHGFSRQPALEPALVERLCLEAWLSNVRQLENVARRAGVLHGSDAELKLSNLSELLPAAPASSEGGKAAAAPARRPYRDEELQALQAALRHHRDNLTKAVAELGITRAKAYRMLKDAKSRGG